MKPLTSVVLALIALVVDSNSVDPSSNPSQSPTTSASPTNIPTVIFSSSPTINSIPTLSPSISAPLTTTNLPTVELSLSATTSSLPSQIPTTRSASPTYLPTVEFSASPSNSIFPSQNPTISFVPTKIPSGNPTVSISPTLAPSLSFSYNPSNIPSQLQTRELTPAPTVRNLCKDREDKFQVIVSGDIVQRDCLWVSVNPSKRCNKNEVNEFCPKTCDNCKCNDIRATFTVNGSIKDCSWVKESLIRCVLWMQARSNCPKTCSLCTDSPTFAPTYKPTISPASIPPEQKSEAPSVVNSLSPSSFPSSKPSLVASSAPSSAPTFSTYYSVDVKLGFRIFAFPMDDSVKEIFEEITKQFIIETKKAETGVNVKITSVKVKSQNRINGVVNGIQNSRRLQKSTDKGLVIALVVAGHVTTKYNSLQDFSFEDTVLNGFYSDFDDYSSILEKDSQIYSSVMGNTNTDSLPSDKKNVENGFIMYVIIGCSVVGGLLVAYLLLMFMKLKHDKQRLSQLPPNLSFQDENEFIKSQRFSHFDQNDDVSPVSDAIHGLNARSLSESQIRTNTNSEIGFRHDSYYSAPIMHDQWEGSFVERNPHLLSEFSGQGYDGMNHYNNHSFEHHTLTPFSDSTDNESLGLNVSPHALNEARKQSQAFSFVPQDQSCVKPTLENTGAFDSICFECDCPPGALGLVIDTSSRGPIVHSLKSSSKVNGMMIPGDIIVALDGEDTRSLTASQLTSMMANKSQNKIRRLTIVRFQ